MKEFNLVEILKDCPKGTPLYSLIHGDVKFEGIFDSEPAHPIVVEAFEGERASFDIYGRFFAICGSCVLYPSKDNRDWSTFKVPKKKGERFDPNTLRPFDKVLGRDGYESRWVAAFFSHINHDFCLPYRVTPGCGFAQVIPYKGNEHLAGKAGEPDEYYRYWEEEDGQTAST